MIPLPPSLYLKLGAAALVLAIVGGVCLTITIQHRKIESLTTANAVLKGSLDQAIKINQDNVAQIAAIKADAERTVAALTKDHAAELQRAQRTTTLKQEIARATPAQDGPAAAVLRGLRDRVRGGAAPGDQDRAGGPVGAAGTPGVLPGTVAPSR